MDFQHHVGTGITPSAEVWLPKEARGLEDAEIVICSEPMWLCPYIRPRTAGVLGDVGEATWFFEVGAAQTPLLPLQRSYSLTLPTASLLFPWTPHAIPYLHVHIHSTSPKRFKPLPVETDGFLVNLSDTVCSATWLKLRLLIIDRIHSLQDAIHFSADMQMKNMTGLSGSHLPNYGDLNLLAVVVIPGWGERRRCWVFCTWPCSMSFLAGKDWLFAPVPSTPLV